MASSDEPQSLRSLFEDAEAGREALETTSPITSPTYAADLATTLSLYTRVLDQAGAAGLFSPNEGAEDISTSALPYLLADFRVAELVQRTPPGDGDVVKARGAVLTRARAAYERFLSLVDGYGLVQAPYHKLLERYRDDADAFSATAGGDAASRREAKIASFRAERELKARIETLRRNPRYLDHGDEELVRELHLASVTFAIHTTFQSLDSMNREASLLAEAPAMPTTRPNPSSDPDLDSARLDQPLSRRANGAPGPLLSREGRPLQPFTLLGSSGAGASRAALTRAVFRPGHRLPTMSIDEYLEEEARRGGVLQGGVEPKTVVDEDDEEAADRETYKAREWDDYKDDNLRGSGNTMNMG